ncbi:hypothetical protein [Vibrio sp. D431a]|uniref:hypothetical protein n=1 Tax=Vibrio sp. D431a TaxID=2837388 RepID=UPI002557624C|nr:hypothetical protein [Vibrio sp. D431a]MDK9793335.1 hypothetical protein [Vibrio sp. D431a]
MKKHTLNIDFIYRALIIKPRCHKPTEVAVRDSIQVDIPEILSSDAPVAFRNGSQEYRLFNDTLWDFDYHTPARSEPSKVEFETVKQLTADISDYKWSSYGAQAPFHNIWHEVSAAWDEQSKISPCNMWLKEVQNTKDTTEYRVWSQDNRDDVVKRIMRKVDTMLVIDGLMFTKINEPRYVVQTFGLSGAHGSTALTVSNWFNINIPNRCYFRADELEKAKEYAEQISTNLRHDGYIFNADSVIDVLIPEAVKLQPSTDHPVK